MLLLDVRAVNKLLSNSKDVLIGVSGGIDSMVLLTWFAQNRHLIKQNLRVMHVNHGINESSDEWANFVKTVCEKFEIPCEVANVSLEGYGNNLEYSARQARYKAFCSTGVDTLVLAHHANDQCESFLLKLFRGSGVRGLKAMAPATACWYDSKVTVIRPMLSVTRSQIESWAELNNVVGIEDPSNKDTKYDRNYIRNVIWPNIQDRFDIADINTIRSIQHLGEAWELTSALADIDIASVTMDDGSLEWTKVKNLGYLRIKNIILRILGLAEVYHFSIGHVEQFTQGLLDATLDSKNELSVKGFTMHKVGKRIYINKSQKQAA
jgi:tRNA(Ile)-lysidine synthase